MALSGAFVGLAGAALPLVELRPNRLVPGVAESLAAAGPVALTVVGALVLAVLAALAPSMSVRRASAVAAAPALVAAVAWTLGAAAERLLVGQGPAARVSLSGGAWVLVGSAAILGLAASRLDPPAASVRRAAMAAGAIGVVGAFLWGGLPSLSLAHEFAVRSNTFWPLMAGHVGLSTSSLASGCVLGIPLGIWATRNRRVRGVVLSVTGVIQTVPSLALLGLLVVPLASLSSAIPVLRELGIRGIGAAPGFIALTLYALLPIVRGTYVGVSGVDAGALDAGRGMGMSGAQLLTRVEMPLAVPLVIDGVRTAAVLVIGITTLTVFAGARNLGVLIFEGLGQFAPDLILLGALPTIMLAILADSALGSLGHALTPKGVRA